MIICPICTAENPDTERFCQECGQRLPISARSTGAPNGGTAATIPSAPVNEPPAPANQVEISTPAPPPAPPTGLSVTAAPAQPSTPGSSAGVSPPAAPTLLRPSPSVSEQAPTTALSTTPGPIVQLPVDEGSKESVAAHGVSTEPPVPSLSMRDMGGVGGNGEDHIVDERTGGAPSSEEQQRAPTADAEESVPELGPEAGHEAAVQVSPGALEMAENSEPMHPTQNTTSEILDVSEDSGLQGASVGVQPAKPDEAPVAAAQPPVSTAEAIGGRQYDGVDCSHCGVRNERSFRFCKACGTPLIAPIEVTEPAQPFDEPPADAVFDEIALESQSGVPATIPIEPLTIPPSPPFSQRQEEPISSSTVPALLCPSCGKPGLEGERFCSECGARLAPVQPGPVGAGCPACGAAFEPGDKFCKACGTRLPASVSSGPRLVLASSGEQKTYALQSGSLTIGRAPGNDISITSDGYISSQHARIVVENGKVYVEDAGSTNGTFLRVRSRTELSNGDEVKVGQSILRYQQG